MPKHPNIDPETGKAQARFNYCAEQVVPVYSGILQGDFGCSTKFKVKVIDKLLPALRATGILMFWVVVVMVPAALLIGVPMAQAPQALQLKKAGVALLRWPAPPPAPLAGSARLELLLPPRLLVGARSGDADPVADVTKGA